MSNIVLILANDNSTIYNFRRELLMRLIEEEYEVVISLPPDERNSEFVKLGCKIEEISMARHGINPIKELNLLRNYIKQIRRINPRIVLTFTVKPNIYGSIACQKLGIPYINNVTGLGSAFQTENIVKKIMLLLQKKAYKDSECVFFQNKENKEFIERKAISHNRGILLPGSGVNLIKHRYEPYPVERDLIKFITIARVRKDKGFDELFEAVKIITSKYKQVEFHIVGWFEDSNYYKQTITEMTEKYPVYYHGTQSQEKVHELISQSHCLIHPSYHEGMANVILEASASGRPCLASDIPGCKEAVEHGKTGYLFKVKNIESLVNAINNFLKLDHKDKEIMGIMGRGKMEREFDRNIVIKAYLDQIQEVFNKISKES